MIRLRDTLLLGALLLPVSCQSPEGARAEANMKRDTQLARMVRENAESIAALRAEVAALQARLDAEASLSAADAEREQVLATLQEIAALNAALADAQRSYTDQHPKVQELQARIDTLALELPEAIRLQMAGEGSD